VLGRAPQLKSLGRVKVGGVFGDELETWTARALSLPSVCDDLLFTLWSVWGVVCGDGVIFGVGVDGGTGRDIEADGRLEDSRDGAFKWLLAGVSRFVTCLKTGRVGSRFFIASSDVITLVVSKGCFIMATRFIRHCSHTRSALRAATTRLAVNAVGILGLPSEVSIDFRGTILRVESGFAFKSRDKLSNRFVCARMLDSNIIQVLSIEANDGVFRLMRPFF